MDIIRSKDNQFVKLYRNLSSSKKQRQAAKSFVLEGERIIRDNLKYTKYILATEVYLKEYPNALIITEELAENISTAVTPQGIFAICEKQELPPIEKILSKEHIRIIILDNIQDPGNMGTIIRTACALGFSAVICRNSCEIYNPKTIRAAMGAVFAVPVYDIYDFDILFNIFNKYQIISLAGAIDGEDILSYNSSSDKLAIFIGNEGNGLSEEIINRCDMKIAIKIQGIESLNAGIAAGILMWELSKNGR